MINKLLLKYIILLSLVTFMFSCSEYLDKVEVADITSNDVFRDFNSFQGFVETLYVGIIKPYKSGRQTSTQYGDDVDFYHSEWWHNGNYRFIFGGSDYNNSYLYTSSCNQQLSWYGGENVLDQSVWCGWKSIRVANIALANIEKLKGASDEEIKLLKGQAYFFRAHYHWEIMRAWGAIPYIDQYLNPDSELKIPVLTFHETAEKVVKDLDKAIELLPVDWDTNEVGMRTFGNNHGRLTKGVAMAEKAEVFLYCGSPLMNGVSTGNYTFNNEYMKRAAEAAWELIQLADQGVYVLEPWATYGDMFHRINGERAGGKEVIFAALSTTGHRWGSQSWIMEHLGGETRYDSPNAKYVDRFGMDNGLPIHDPESGYDPSNPWVNRDPRFYYNILLDGERIAQNVSDARAFAQYYVGGRDKNISNSMTGYGHKKYRELTANSIDNGWNPRHLYQTCFPRFRLAEIYLFYAEAVNEAYGPNGSHPGAALTAVDAVNIVRARAGVPGIHSKYTSSTEIFRNEIWNERAVELAFEVKRWYDIRRWYVAHLEEYKQIWALDFDKDHSYFEYRLVRNRVFEMKHYWMPFPNSQVTLYESWKQNPGW